VPREEKGLYRGTPHRGSQLGACKLLGCAEEKPRVSIDALEAVVAQQLGDN